MKSEYRLWLRKMQDYVKITNLAVEYGLAKTTLSRFMQGSDWAISLDKLEEFKKFIKIKLIDLF